MKKMYEFHEAGYEVVASSMWGDSVVDFDEEYGDYDEEFEAGYSFHHVDEEAKVAYFYDSADYDD